MPACYPWPMTGKTGTALIYAFSAWMAAACCVYAGELLLPARAQTALRCAAVAACYAAAFRLYFSRRDGLAPVPAAALCLALVAAVDWLIVARRMVRPSLFFLSFWDWQLPAALAFGSVLWAGRERL